VSNGTATYGPVAASNNGSPASLASSQAPVKATIINRSKQGSAPIYCMFNPKEYAFSKDTQWELGDTKGKNIPQLEFKGGKPANLSLELIFDTYGMDPPKDVRKEYTNALWELTLVDNDLKDKKNNTGRPPTVRFQWGEAWSFDAVITKMTQKFTMFLSNGTPVRAVVDLTFQQITDNRELGMQNPTSGGVEGTRLWTVSEGDTLAWIAYQHYGDTAEWRRIADANRLTQVRHLRAGTVLELPSA
jgi:nucleoid-associated protein YgaU